MHLNADHLRVLRALYRASARGRRLTPVQLERATALNEPCLAAALRELGALDLVDARQRSLTLAGLAVAVAFARRPARMRVATAA